MSQQLLRNKTGNERTRGGEIADNAAITSNTHSRDHQLHERLDLPLVCGNLCLEKYLASRYFGTILRKVFPMESLSRQGSILV